LTTTDPCRGPAPAVAPGRPELRPRLRKVRSLRLAPAHVVAVAVTLLDRTFTDAAHLVALLLGFGIGRLVEEVRDGPGAAAHAG
jgi:hypothetical protein